MKTNFKDQMREVMNNAWRMFRVTGESFAVCLKRAWQLLRLSQAIRTKTVQFFYRKVNGEVRQAFGTMREDVISDKVKGNDIRRKNNDLFTYFDTEKGEFRSFKKFNLVSIA